MKKVNSMVDQYYSWLRDNTIINEIENFTEITTPFLDRHNDCIQLYVRKDGDVFYICDDSYTIDDLQMSGVDINTPKRKELLRNILSAYGININRENELFVTCTEKDFPLKKHFFIQAIQDINNLCYTVKSTVTSIFMDDVNAYFELHEIRTMTNIQLVGKSGLPTKIDFALAKSKHNPERYIQILNTINKQTTEHILFGWQDLRDVRKDSQMIVFLNDDRSKVKPDIIQAYSSYGIKHALWSEREQESTLKMFA